MCVGILVTTVYPVEPDSGCWRNGYGTFANCPSSTTLKYFEGQLGQAVLCAMSLSAIAIARPPQRQARATRRACPERTRVTARSDAVVVDSPRLTECRCVLIRGRITMSTTSRSARRRLLSASAVVAIVVVVAGSALVVGDTSGTTGATIFSSTVTLSGTISCYPFTVGSPNVLLDARLIGSNGDDTLVTLGDGEQSRPYTAQLSHLPLDGSEDVSVKARCSQSGSESDFLRISRPWFSTTISLDISLD